MCKHTAKKLPFVIRYISDRYNSQEICLILENGEAVKSVSDCYKNQAMYIKAADNYAHALEFDIRKNIFACPFSVHNAISLSRHEQVCLNILAHDVINVLYYNIRI